MAKPIKLNRGVISGSRLSARGRALVVLGLVMSVGAALSLFNAPLASSAANSVEVMRIAEAVPTDPQSQLWGRAKEAEIPLSAQQIYQPGGGTTRAVRVRALTDGQTIGFRVSWDDPTRNDSLGNIPSDAAAIQLPMDPSLVPYQCMGQSTSRVNIWQWKAALEKQGIEAGGIARDDVGVRNLTSNGICKAVETPGITPQVRSHHDGSQWHVVYYRALSAAGLQSGAAPLVIGTNSSIAFAVWNGARGEARGMKAVSTWNTLQMPAAQSGAVGSLLTLGAILIISAGAVAYTMRRLAT